MWRRSSWYPIYFSDFMKLVAHVILVIVVSKSQSSPLMGNSKAAFISNHLEPITAFIGHQPVRSQANNNLRGPSFDQVMLVTRISVTITKKQILPNAQPLTAWDGDETKYVIHYVLYSWQHCPIKWIYGPVFAKCDCGCRLHRMMYEQCDCSDNHSKFSLDEHIWIRRSCIISLRQRDIRIVALGVAIFLESSSGPIRCPISLLIFNFNSLSKWGWVT